ncbi:glycosyltransferase family 2 protein [Polaribacter litorisediminis]|uniref:glycosyltransferase family 2 protein n=1 Tax=Polaribacter litorisediminis TaxID=1908341 RepID=UPI001CC009EC|nr:glycosyltransferase family 2 protein [Polaribacter litorisediminis]UAM98222.1 glycosyltransferase family 2 protein [Polaribacter litorisediminis]
MQLSIIIVNYNGKHYLKDCLESIYVHCSSFSYEIIMVDNNSTDGSQEYITLNYPEIKLFQEKQNLGFGKANNLGVQYSNGNNILLLNNDTILLHDIYPVLKEVKKEEIGVVGIYMFNADRQYTSSVGKFPKPLDLIRLSNLNEKREEFITGKFDKNSYEVDWVSGSFMMIKRKDWNLIGGFDEDFFMYVEDVDLCKRIHNLGKKIIFLSKISYVHFIGFNTSREIKLITGYKLFSAKHFNLVSSILAEICLKINYVYKKRFKNIR